MMYDLIFGLCCPYLLGLSSPKEGIIAKLHEYVD